MYCGRARVWGAHISTIKQYFIENQMKFHRTAVTKKSSRICHDIYTQFFSYFVSFVLLYRSSSPLSLNSFTMCRHKEALVVKDNKNGTYTAFYNIAHPGVYVLSITNNGGHIRESPMVRVMNMLIHVGWK